MPQMGRSLIEVNLMPQMGRSLIEVNIDASNGSITDRGQY